MQSPLPLGSDKVKVLCSCSIFPDGWWCSNQGLLRFYSTYCLLENTILISLSKRLLKGMKAKTTSSAGVWNRQRCPWLLKWKRERKQSKEGEMINTPTPQPVKTDLTRLEKLHHKLICWFMPCHCFLYPSFLVSFGVWRLTSFNKMGATPVWAYDVAASHEFTSLESFMALALMNSPDYSHLT